MVKYFRFRSNNIILVAFLLTLLLVSTLVITAQQITATTLSSATQVVDNQYQKQHNLMNLHIAGQKRTVDIQRILLSDDPFDKDAALMGLYEDGMHYTHYRDQLAALVESNEHELDWLNQIRAMGKETGPLHNRIADLAMAGQTEAAKQLLTEEGFAKLDRFSHKVNEFSLDQATEIKKSIGQARQQVDQLMQSIILLATTLIIVSMLFSVFLGRRFNIINHKLRQTNDNLEQEVQARTQELTAAQDELLQQNKMLERLSITDPLTQLFNRLKIERVLENCHAEFEKSETNTCVLLVDLDNFKAINDNFGHQAGDQVLQDFAKLLLQTFRNNAYIGRWGGEEFIVVLEHSDKDFMVRLAEELRGKVENHRFPEVEQVTISGGIACMQKSESISELLDRADSALYRSKNKGRNQITL
ncbi:diguanylate cyclase [Thiomicrorhabdus sp. ZW0627]|uniref:GGDEF domain-containing protein n=1 Tax=Thiomicrorhabdus sp. ZW0627 TaxID=3039774 RepID=UPI002436BDE5|nr:diguanylate cyclase [Thiomicrorhabdus sp. ZW0627]MDG6774371.1 diguanylate cyclase [Thiomicrorhabdus sp. ZW0627]